MTQALMERADQRADAWADISLMEGGPLRRLQRSAGLPDGPRGLACLVLALALLTWAPLVALAAIGNVLTSGPTVPFLQSIGTHVRLLIAVPLFFVAEVQFNRRSREAIRTIVDSQLVSSRQLPVLRTALLQAQRRLSSWIVEAAIVGLTIVLITEGVRSDLPGAISTWRQSSTGGQTLAGWWYLLVSLPLFQFLVWRWCARLLIWGHLLWRIGRLDLQLLPAHPDLSGGLGGLGIAHVALAPLGFALSAIIVATFAEDVAFGGASVRSIVLPITVTVVGNAVLLVAPLLLFTSRLLETKQQGLLEYSRLAADYTRAFDTKWVRSGVPSREPLLGTADVQSLADLANAYNVIRQMRLVPIARNQMMFLVEASSLPAVPLIFFVVPLDEWLIRLVKTIAYV